MNNTVMKQEHIIVANSLQCSKEIKRLFESTNIGLTEPTLKKRVSIYSTNFNNLATELNPLFESEKNLNSFLNDYAIKNNHGNYYAYFKKVLSVLNENDSSILKSLNESIKPLFNPLQKNSTVDISTLKTDLKKLIEILDKKDETFELSNQILNIKKSLKKPIIVHGVDVVRFDILFDDIAKFINTDKKTFENLLVGVAYNKKEKQLYFIPTNLSQTICYDLLTDEINLFNNMFEFKLPKMEVKPTTFKQILCELLHNNIIDLYVNVSMLNLKYTDNMYSDISIQNKINAELKKKSEQNIFAKL